MLGQCMSREVEDMHEELQHKYANRIEEKWFFHHICVHVECVKTKQHNGNVVQVIKTNEESF